MGSEKIIYYSNEENALPKKPIVNKEFLEMDLNTYKIINPNMKDNMEDNPNSLININADWIDLYLNKIISCLSSLQEICQYQDDSSILTDINNTFNNILECINNISVLSPQKVQEVKDKVKVKKSSSEERFRINMVTKNYLIAHYNAADLTLIEDWKELSHQNIDMLNKSYSSLIKPIKALNQKVYIRDTILLASAAAATLAVLGDAHRIPKLDIDPVYKPRMDLLYQENFDLFKRYAMQDSLITLIHALFINDFSFNTGKLTMPVTLGSISNTYTTNKWKEDGYRGYQINHNFPLGNAQTSYTPKGINALGFTGEVINSYLAAFRGVMSMMGNPEYTGYEFDEQQDESRVLTNMLAEAGDPDYAKTEFINASENQQILKKYDMKKSYTVLKVDFNLPDCIKYPPLPVSLDKTITIYPLSGITTISGAEFLSACNILNNALERIPEKDRKLYYIKVIYGAHIPFKQVLVEDENGIKRMELSYQPFYEIINELQRNRRLHPKKSPMERFVRATLAELLNQVHSFGGKICSVTTDGFVCDIPDLENKIIKYYKENGIKESFLFDYRNTRMKLSGNPDALELKTSVKGLIQWTTRGQLSYDEDGKIPITAMTGFQHRQFDLEHVKKLVLTALAEGNQILFLQKHLTGARNDEHVSFTSSARSFRTIFDSKRQIINSTNPMLDTKPYKDVSQALLTRSIMNQLKTSVYSEDYTSKFTFVSSNTS
ncbi:hypothetical protein L873DRAFT_1796612 [Choiromyces venosus 120613-1]|uniref:Uncharacterized protein n=1 Tax=Choiromyces venosus 120613-1 TaxID=1336337 RepID=A0A3N4IRT1_9PEZI|nr:hypothetical protein L873DRAFT_1796612 [Choiromyces venosus 120613-1]